jgi:hypothetical protein
LFCGDSSAWWNLSIHDRTSFIFFSHCSHSSLVSWSNAFFKSKMYIYKIKNSFVHYLHKWQNSHQKNSKSPFSRWTECQSYKFYFLESHVDPIKKCNSDAALWSTWATNTWQYCAICQKQ